MIISHKHKFIFIKTNKTAGTSTEIALSKYCGPDDIVTEVSKRDEEKRRRLGYPGPRNHLVPFGDYGGEEWMTLLRRRRRPRRFYNHISGAEIRERIAPEIWESYFKFAIERNPWDRVISNYYWSNQHKQRPSLLEWLKSGGHHWNIRLGRELYMLDGNIGVDRIIRFETLERDLSAIGVELGFDGPVELPRTKTETRKDKRHFSEVLGPEERDIIARDFAFEIETFGYQF